MTIGDKCKFYYITRKRKANQYNTKAQELLGKTVYLKVDNYFKQFIFIFYEEKKNSLFSINLFVVRKYPLKHAYI